MLSFAIEKSLQDQPDICTTDSFVNALQKHLSNALKEGLVSTYIVAHDELVCWCMQALERLGHESQPNEAELFHHVCYYLDNIVYPYLQENAIATLDKITQQEVCGCLSKQFCMVAGKALAEIESSAQLSETLQILSEGV